MKTTRTERKVKYPLQLLDAVRELAKHQAKLAANVGDYRKTPTAENWKELNEMIGTLDSAMSCSYISWCVKNGYKWDPFSGYGDDVNESTIFTSDELSMGVDGIFEDCYSLAAEALAELICDSGVALECVNTSRATFDSIARSARSF